MFVIGDNTLVSLDVIEKEFCCDLDTCRGCCCIEGDAGCPVTDEELKQIEAILPELLPHMTKEARKVVEEQGLSYLDPSMTKNSQFSILNSQFSKPISCHLYPIRLTKVGEYIGLEYHRWDICHCARIKGKKIHLPLYQFLKEPLIRRFGQAWYDELCLTADEWHKQMMK